MVSPSILTLLSLNPTVGDLIGSITGRGKVYSWRRKSELLEIATQNRKRDLGEIHAQAAFSKLIINLGAKE